MKKNICSIFFLALSLTIWGLGCDSPSGSPGTGPSSNPAPTSTLTPNLTPVCGYSGLIAIYDLQLSDAGIHVIKNMTDWNNFYQGAPGYPPLSPRPTPMVDLNSYMMITAGVPNPCAPYGFTFTGICVGPDHVVINVTQSTCTSCPSCGSVPDHCDLANNFYIPQSSLPVDIVYNYVTY